MKIPSNKKQKMEKITKEEIQKLMGIKGETRGVTFTIDRDYVFKNRGEEGLKKVEEEFERLGYPIKYKKIETFNYYPVGLRALSLLVIKKVFKLDDEEIEKIGFFGTKSSLVAKFFIKYVVSLKKVFFQESQRIWQEHWTIGKIVPAELNEEKKYAVLHLKDFNLHPIYCVFLKGYLSGLFSMVIKSSKITCQETKCSLKGDEYHEYLIKW